MPQLQVSLRNASPMPLAAEFDCAAGELIALVGPSGSGKTSLLRAVAGLLRAPHLEGRINVAGKTWFDSERGANLTPQERCVGLVFQHYALFPHLSALENIGISACGRYSREEAEPALRELMMRLGLAELADRRPAQLSGGQQQRVALARALMRITLAAKGDNEESCGVLLLDEPFSAVDAPARQTLYRELASLRQQVSTPMVLVTHDLGEARRLADRVVIVDAGKTLQSGPPDKVFSSPRNARVAELVGIQNHFRGRFVREAGDVGRLTWLDAQGTGLALRVTDKHRLDDDVPVTWVLAGEHVDIQKADTNVSGYGANRVLCTMQELLSLGETSLCTLLPDALEGERVTLNLSSSLVRSLGLGPGSKVTVQMPQQAIHIMPQRTGN